MNAKHLMDSRRFCTLMDDLATTWKKRGATDEDREFRLEAVLAFLRADNGRFVADAFNEAAESPGSSFAAPTREELKAAVVVEDAKPKDIYTACAEWAREKGAKIAALPAVDPTGLRLLAFPTNLDPNVLHMVCEREADIPFTVDTSDSVISMAGGVWQVPVRLR